MNITSSLTKDNALGYIGYMIKSEYVKCRVRNHRAVIGINGVDTEIGIGDILLPGITGVRIRSRVKAWGIIDFKGFEAVALLVLQPI